MSASKERLRYLLQKYTEKKCTLEEYRELFSYLEQEENKGILYEYMDERYVSVNPEQVDKTEEDWDQMYQQIRQNVKPAKKRWINYRWMAAAAVALIVSMGVYLLNERSDQTTITATNSKKSKPRDIAPGTDKAILTLADGSELVLEEAKKGALAVQGRSKILKDDQGRVIYKTSEHQQSEPAEGMNKISIPSGGQYQLVLSDGTKVWLNSESSLTFPAAFEGKARKVTLTGEAYFEVAHNKQMPFEVLTGETKVKVLGTHFNIMAYADEPFARTTLLEGSVSITKGTESHLLKPGQEARHEQGSTEIQIQEVDAEAAVAWKENLFVFEKTPLEQIMRQIKRWYDVDVIYRNNMSNVFFTGVIPRNKNVSEVLKTIESAGGAGFKIEDGKVIVEKK